MKAAHCSLSALGRSIIVSKIWIRVLASTYIELSSGPLRENAKGGCQRLRCDKNGDCKMRWERNWRTSTRVLSRIGLI